MDMSTTREDYYRVQKMLHRTMENMDDLELAFAYADYMDGSTRQHLHPGDATPRPQFTDLEQMLIDYYDN